MADPVSPLGDAYRPGLHGDISAGPGVALSEPQPGSIVQAAAWPGQERALLDAIRRTTGLALPDGAGGGVAREATAAFGFAPGRFLIIDDDEGLAARLAEATARDVGTVTDLSHGRTAIRIAGPRAEWVLQKLFAVDFSLPALPVGSGLSTAHHDIFAMVQRTGASQFDLYVFRSFARAFWTALCHASEEVGYEVR